MFCDHWQGTAMWSRTDHMLRLGIQTQQLHKNCTYITFYLFTSPAKPAVVLRAKLWSYLSTSPSEVPSTLNHRPHDRSDQQLRVCDWVHLNVHVQYLVIIKAFLTQGVMLWDPPTWRGPRRRGTEFVCECGAILLLSAMMLRTQEPRWSCSPEFTSMIVSPKCRKPSCDTDKLT